MPCIEDKGAAGLYRLLRPYKTVYILGLSTGAGKTTVQGRLINAYQQEKTRQPALPPLAVTSIGQGGSLPGVYVYKGMFAATAESLFRHCDFTRRIIHTTGVNTPLGEVVVTEALSDGRARLAGPSINSQLAELCGYLMEECGAGQVLVDGAGDKKTFAAAGGAAVLCVEASHADMRAIIREAAHACRVMSLPAYDSKAANTAKTCQTCNFHAYDNNDTVQTDAVFIKGALTDTFLMQILENNGNSADRVVVVAADASKVFLKAETLDTFLRRGGRLFVERPVKLAAVAANPRGVDRQSFLTGLREAVPVPVFDVMDDAMENNHGTIY